MSKNILGGTDPKEYTLRIIDDEDKRELEQSKAQVAELNRELARTNEMLNQAHENVRRLTRELSDAKNAVGIDVLEAKVSQFEKTAELASEEFKNFLKVYGLMDSKATAPPEEYAAWVDQLKAGLISYQQAVTKVKLEHGDLIKTAGGAGVDTSAFTEIISMLEAMSKSISDVTSKLQDMQDNGIKSTGGGAVLDVAKTMQQVDEVVTNLSEDAKQSYESITNIIKAINAFGGGDSYAIASLSNTFKAISDLGKGTFGETKTGNILSLITKLNELSKDSNGVLKFEIAGLNQANIKASNSFFSNLAKNLPILENVNFDKLSRISSLRFDNFNDISVKSGSLNSIAKLIQAISELKEVTGSKTNLTVDGITTDTTTQADQLDRIAESADAAAGSMKNLADANKQVIVNFGADAADVKDIEGALREIGGIGSGNAKTIASMFSGLSDRITQVRAVWGNFGEFGDHVSRVIVKSMNDAGDAIERVIRLRPRVTDDGTVWDPIASGSATLKFKPDEAYDKAAASLHNYYEELRKVYAANTDIEQQTDGTFMSASGNAKYEARAAKLNELKRLMDEYNSEENKNNMSQDERNRLQEALNAELEKTARLQKQLEEARLRNADFEAEQKRNEALKEANEYLDEMKRKFEQTGNLNLSRGISDLSELIDQLDNKKISPEEFLQKFKALREETNKPMGAGVNSFASGLSKHIAMWFSSYRIIMKVIHGIKQLISTSIELDSAMAQMQIVTRASDATMNKFGETAARIAKETATSITDVLSSATTYARLGYSLDESAQLAKYTGMIQRVGNIDVSDAQDAITAIVKAWDIDVDNIEDVMDKLVIVGNNFPISVSQIAEGMNNASSSLAAAGNSMEEAIALLTAANVTVQNASRASTGLRTITARLRNTKAELEELGEEPIATPKYEELVKQLTDYKVSLLDEVTGQYRSTYDILHDLAMEWDNISPNIQAAIKTALAGTRQQDILTSIIAQFKEATGAMDMMTESANALNDAYSVYMDTAQAHIDSFKASVQELAQEAVDRGLVTSAVDFAKVFIKITTWVFKLVDATTGLAPIILSIGSAVAALNMSKIIAKLKTIRSQITSLKKNLDAVNDSGVLTKNAALTQIVGGVGVSVAASMAIINFFEKIHESRRLALAEQYEEAAANVKEVGSIHDLFSAYKDTWASIDNGVDSKQALADAAVKVAEALGYEGDAARSAVGDIEELTQKEIKLSADNALVALEKATKALINTLNELTIFADSPEFRGDTEDNLFHFANLFGVDLLSGDDKQRADALLSLYTKLSDRQRELARYSDSGTKKLSDITDDWSEISMFGDSISNEGNAIDIVLRAIAQVVKNYSEAKDVYEENEKVLNETAQDVKEIEARKAGFERLNELASEYNSLVNGNVDYRKRPFIMPDDMVRAGWTEWKKFQEAVATTYSSGFTIGKGEFTIDITPILEDGTVLSPQALQDYVESLDTSNGVEGVLASDTYQIIIDVQEGEYDADFWDDYYSSLDGIKNEHLEVARSLGLVRSGYKELAQEARDTLSSALGSEEFEKVEEKLKELLRTTGKITPNNIIELANESEELSKMLHISGMDAKFLAHVLNRELTAQDGSGISLVTDQALRLNNALERMSGDLAELSVAKNKYDEAMSAPEKDDEFKSMAEAFKTLNDEFVAGTTNSNKFWAAAEYLFGADQLATWGWSEGLQQIHDAMSENVNVFKDADSSGKGFLERLNQIAEDGKVLNEDGGLIASIEKLENGDWEFYIDDLHLDELSEKMNLSKDAILACVKALSKWGRVDFFDIGSVINTIFENDAGNLVSGHEVVNVQKLIGQLNEDTGIGRTAKEINDLMESLKKSGVVLIDVSGDAKSLADQLVSVGIASREVNASGELFHVKTDDIAQFADAIGLSDEELGKLIEKLQLVEGLSFSSDTSQLKDTKDIIDDISKKRVTKPKSDLEQVGDAAEGAMKKTDKLKYALGDITHQPWVIKITFDIAKRKFDEVIDQINASNGGEVHENADGYPSSYARGTKGAAPGRSLVGEEEPELWVHDGQARLVGTNGPEIVDLGAGDIIYNGAETRRIMKSLRYIKGSIPSFIGGYNPSDKWSSVLTGAGSGSSGGSGSGSSSSSADKAETWFEKEYKLHQHMLKMEAEDAATYLNWLNVAYQKAYNTNIITLDDFRKYQEEVFEGTKNLFMDYLNDIEHEISMRNGFIGTKGERKKIIQLYRQMIGAIEDEIQSARARGLTDTDDYIQELQQKWASYFSELADMRDEVVGNTKDSIENLIDIRINMIKQNVDDEKDALNERLSNLKEFYDKQKDLLRDSRDEEKYLDDQAEKRKKIADLQFKIAEIELDNSASAQKRRVKLLDDLEKAQKELDDFEKDHAIEVTEKDLDKIYERQEKEIQDQIKAVEAQVETPYELRQQAIEDLYSHGRTGELYQEMIEWNNKYGDGIEATITEAWKTAYEALEQYREVMDATVDDPAFISLVNALSYPAFYFAKAIGHEVSTRGWDYASVSKNGRGSNSLSGISKYASGTKRARPGVGSFDEAGTETFISKDGTKYRMFTGGEMVLNHKASQFLYNFATSGGAMLSGLIKEVIGGASALLRQRQMVPQAVNMGDIIIQGNADMQTVSEIRRAQRDALDNVLREFKKLGR